jgi:hypothetical protein
MLKSSPLAARAVGLTTTRGSIFYRNGCRLGLRTSQQSVNDTFHPLADLFENLFYPIHPTCLVGVTKLSGEFNPWTSMIALLSKKQGNALVEST